MNIEKLSYAFLASCVVAILILLAAMPVQAVNWNSRVFLPVVMR